MSIPLQKLDLESMSKIQVSFEKGFSRITDYLDILIIKYNGQYGFGSAGNEDASFMCAKAAFAIEAVEPCATVIDLTNLKYEWGDRLEMIFSISKEIPMSVIVGENCKEAIGTLVHGIESTESPTTIEWIFDNLEESWKYLEMELEKKRKNDPLF